MLPNMQRTFFTFPHRFYFLRWDCMSSTSTHPASEDSRYWRYAQPSASSSSHNPIPCDGLSQSSLVASRHLNQPNGYTEGFDVSVNVKRAFTFEELQSGAYFNSLDESDLQFFGMYGQPVLIPCPEDSDQGGWSLQGQTHIHPAGDSSSCTTTTQYAPHSNLSTFQISKSYTLVDSLGQLSTSTSAKAPSSSAQGTRVSATAPAAGHSGAIRVKHEPGLIQQSLYPSDFPSSRPVLHHSRQPYVYEGSRLTHDSEDIKPNRSILDEEPPMDHLPYPPPVHSVSTHQFQPYSPPQEAMTHSPSPCSPHSTAFLGTSHHDASEVPVTVPSQSYMFVEDSSTPAFIHTSQQHYHSPNESSSHTHDRRTRSPYQRSPSPRGALRITPPPHPKRSMDKKPALACLFCRGRKIACGPPVPGSKDRTCNQCARRHLKCEYPLESRRGMRKRRSLIPRGSGSPVPETNSGGPKVIRPGRKRSIDKRP
ncbi:uncharacterized protein EDB91DRAFT_598591 [Suillus paluster]|uniref:uncharacterized protein n=1 Tax=Suillus paluster TaxID=48578 RepID=UPI001B87AFF6|nr:uncharacterized protein EDB91DRAFT_598591 [Suillus paluster]KAG1751289.1 hypothetical protein EDB91DRAFT_598591 [Suillus paluster]